MEADIIDLKMISKKQSIVNAEERIRENQDTFLLNGRHPLPTFPLGLDIILVHICIRLR